MILSLGLNQIQADVSSVTAAIRKAAQPVSVGVTREWRELDDLVKDAHVVGLGECTHGSSELLTTRASIVLDLVARHGVRLVAIELPFGGSVALDDYIVEGIGSADDALRGCGYWVCQTEEFRDFVEALRAWNKDRPLADRVHMVGVDMQDTSQVWGGVQSLCRRAGYRGKEVTDIYWYPKTRYDSPGKMPEAVQAVIDKALALTTGPAMASVRAKLMFAAEVYRQANESVRRALVEEDLYDLTIDVGPNLAEVGKRLPQVANLPGLSSASRAIAERLSKPPTNALKPTAAELKTLADEVAKLKGDKQVVKLLQYVAKTVEVGELRLDGYRDAKMAENVLRLRDTFSPGRTAVFWGHNSHVSTAAPLGLPPMAGARLATRLGPGYVPIGFAFASGGLNANSPRGEGRVVAQQATPLKQPDAVEQVFHATGFSAFFLDTARLDNKTKAWLETPHPMRNVGHTYDEQAEEKYVESYPWGQWFRAFIFIDKLTPSRLLTWKN